MDLARELSRLAEQVEWPVTPALRPALEPRRRASRRRLAAALVFAALVVAVAVSFAVPQSRAAILRFFHLGAMTIQVVDTLPPAQERALGADLGPTVTLAEARRRLPQLLLPPLDPVPPLHSPGGPVVALVFEHDGKTVLLSEYGYGQGFFKKLLGDGTQVVGTHVGSDYGLWISGAPHNFGVPGTSPRLAGNVLVWEHGSVTYRLEGALTEPEALKFAAALRR